MSAETETIEGEALELYEPPAAPGLFGTDDPERVIVKAAAVSDALARVIRDRKLYARISGNEHVLVGGWTLLGSMLGVFPITVWSRPLDDGWEARVEARTLDGRIVGAAESECLRSERRWAKADDYAIRSMAQTRATSKALRMPLGFVMELAGFDATPADEMPAEPTPAPTAKESPGKIPPEHRPTDEQKGELLALLRTLQQIKPDRDWAKRCRELTGVTDRNMLTRTTMQSLIERLQDDLKQLNDKEAA
jgi:hypothetical protein